MDKPPNTETGRPNNIIYFRPALFGNAYNKRLNKSSDRKRNNDPLTRTYQYGRSSNKPNRRSGSEKVINIKQAFLLQKNASRTHDTLSLSGFGITDDARRYIRTQYINLISKAFKNNDAARLSSLYGKTSFKMMRPEDKLMVATELFRRCGLEQMGGNPIAGLSLCFSEAFRRGYGNRNHFHNWIRLTHKSLRIQTLERFAMAMGLNEEIRHEVNAVLANSYIRAAEDQVLLGKRPVSNSILLDELVEKSIDVLARFQATDKRIRSFADRILRINRIRFDSDPQDLAIRYIFTNRNDHGDPPSKTCVEISLLGL